MVQGEFYIEFYLALFNASSYRVLFLPKAYLNGGMLFSNVILLCTASLAYWCFVLLIQTRTKVEGSYGDIGGVLYGPKMRIAILCSIVISQIGFSAAYIGTKPFPCVV